MSRTANTFGTSQPLDKVTTMFWKLLSLQKFLDALFDDSWFSLGLPDGFDGMDMASTELS